MMICPSCKVPVDYTDNVTVPGKVARAGVSWFVCLRCATISRFIQGEGGELALREATADELADNHAGERAITIGMRRFALTLLRVRKPG